MMIGDYSANRNQQKKRECMQKKVDSVNADSTKHTFISHEKLTEFEMFQGIKMADQEVRGTVRQPPAPTGGPPERTLDSSVGNLYDGGRSTETRAPTRANRTDWTVSPRAQNCLQTTRKGRTSLVEQQSLLCSMSTQSKTQETRLVKLALAESLCHRVKPLLSASDSSRSYTM